MNIYTAPYVSGAPDWSAVPSVEIGNLLWTESCDVRAWAQLCWTEDALHLRLRAAERDIPTLYPNATGFCAEDETGCVCAMLFALPQTIVKGEKQLKAAYLYAVATKKEHRGQGYCRAVMAYAEKELRKRYVEALLLSPATQDLADFYARLGFSRQMDGSKLMLNCAEAKGQATEIGVQDYAGLRETALWDISHVRYDKAQLEYAVSGGKFYCLMAGYSMGCAAVKAGDAGTRAFVYELLPDQTILGALAEKLGAGQYEVQTAQDGQDGETWCMLKWLDKEYPEFEPVYMGFALE